MTRPRDEMLARIRGALRDIPPGVEAPPLERRYRVRDDAPRDGIIALFAERVADYRATVHRIDRAGLSSTIMEAARRRGARALAAPRDLPDDWIPDGMRILRDDGLSPGELDETDGVLSGCALGIAQTGTIALDGGPHQGRRALTLLPDYHLCVVFEHQIVGLVPEAIARLHSAAAAGRPITFISGPSATSDIELNRVEGVHGPRTLEVLVVSE